MSERVFVQYVGSADFHDGRIVDVRHDADAMRVHVCGASKRVYVAEFPGGKVWKINRPVGMFLYSLSEMRTNPPLQHCVFANWDEEDDAALEIEADALNVYDDSPRTS
jgi:hypothetical protein